MALTSAQKAKVRLYMGWSSKYTDFDTALESAMASLANDSDGETLLIAAIASLESVETKIVAAYDCLKVAEVGSIRLEQFHAIRMLRSEGRRHCAKIAVILGINQRHDYFSGSLYRGRHTMDRYYPYYGGGNIIPQG